MPLAATACTAASTPIPAAAGIGLRFPHHRAVLADHPTVAWMEVHPENYMDGGLALAHLLAVRRDHPISLHGVGLSPGSADGIDEWHLNRLAALVDRIEPGLVSEHVAWSTIDGVYLGDLLPLPLTEEALAVICRNVDAMQTRLRRQVLMENPASYLTFMHSTIPEPDFIAEMARRTGCGILCDVNNIVVSAANHGFDARAYLRALPIAAVGEIHVAGHTIRTLEGGRVLRIDDHAHPVPNAVWLLLDEALAMFGPRPVLVEWDNRIPPLPVLLAEAAHADRAIQAREEATHARAA